MKFNTQNEIIIFNDNYPILWIAFGRYYFHQVIFLIFCSGLTGQTRTKYRIRTNVTMFNEKHHLDRWSIEVSLIVFNNKHLHQ